MFRFFTVVLGSIFFFGPHTKAENWAHWRGPTGNGAAAIANPPTQWSDTENVKWKVAIPGRGSGSPVIWGDQVFVVTAVGEEDEGTSEGIRSFRRAIWRSAVPDPRVTVVAIQALMLRSRNR